MINIGQISTKLSALPIQELSNSTQFSIHKDNELTGEGLVVGFFVMLSQGHNTLKDWVEHISVHLNRVFSTAALQAKLQYRHVGFVKALLSYILSDALHKSSISGIESKALAPFSRVLVEDSTCISLPRNMSQDFGSSYSKKGEAATARIQCRIDIKGGAYSHVEVQSYRDNDLKYAPQILSTLQCGDLVIRDLGYWILQVFAMIDTIGAFFLSRLKMPINVYEIAGEKQIDLVEMLHQADLKGQVCLDKRLLLGATEKQPIRVVFIKVPLQVEQERRRKAKQNRDKRHPPSKQYLALLSWTILVTNVDESIWTPQHMMQVYSLRWRIEILFKAWKSHFYFEKMFQSKQKLTPPRVIITIYLVLIWILLFFLPLFNTFLSVVFKKHQKFISLIRFAKFAKNHFRILFFNDDHDFYVELAAKTCCYDIKYKGSNFYQKFSLFNSLSLIVNEL